ncbi:MAG: glycine--tRNA ligase subunit beta, partial [Anaerolineae bacterium]|nr:glycine--tRNA ligase subunit beta [Candidatus Roseilinea sp.]MDW8450446.1 glycine--tRNA ligase subunit beta [Anaerolineae bacterium]
QDLILALQTFWASKGCLIWQPYNQVVGAGTMNPATFLRVLGPEPWNVAYVEPSVRPDDGRFGQNPNRLYTHTQFQVILKPSPERSQELYLESLRAIGIDLARHDVRFVEDNWAQPAIGAWGLGWEVWLDGLEITQYTYFQQVGGITLDPVCLEITYGLERIAMAQQGVRSVFDLRWSADRTYGDVKLSDEQERSAYAFNYADVEALRALFDIYERECKRAIEHGLVLPAHDYVLQCSNTFNLLDTRGAIGVTERQRYLGRMRDLAREVALKYVAQRETFGFPWLVAEDKGTGRPGDKETRGQGERETRGAEKVNVFVSPRPLVTPSTLLLELGTEELPAGDVPVCQEQLGRYVVEALDAARIGHGDVTLIGTPRRTAVLVKDVAPKQRDIDEMVKGPPARAAFDKDGNPTQAAIGFAKRFSVDARELVVQEDASGAYVYARKREAGKPTIEALAQALPQAIGKITFEKTMRWNASNVAFSRPINWIVALLGDQVIPFTFAGVPSGNVSFGPRGEGSPQFTVDHADHYLSLIACHHIIGDRAARKAEIARQIAAAAASIGGCVAPDDDLLDEVTDLVEQPTAVLCAFEEEFLALPSAVLTAVMRKKQRYFTVLRADGEALLPYFITVRNGNDAHLDEVRKGNEDVVRARFADAAYFFRQDISKPLEAYLPRLDTITFQAKLGSMLDKTRRIEALVEPIAQQLRLEIEELEIARKAARLCKADLATSMVVEITALQGVMGREYHRRTSDDADKDAVAEAIFEHYLPRFAGDATPKTAAGLVVSLADKLDSIAGLFAVGLAPKGSADPFALRRAAIGIVQSLTASGKPFSLRAGLESAMAHLPVTTNAEVVEAAHRFILDRERQQFLDEGYRHDAVEAIVAVAGDDPARAKRFLAQLSEAMAHKDWPATLDAYARCARIVRAQAHAPSAIVEDPEPAAQALAHAVAGLEKPFDVQSLVANLRSLVAPITRFFDEVLVMAEDPGLRASRLALLQRIVAQADGIADLSKLEGF